MEVEKVITNRIEFSLSYAKEKGWIVDPNKPLHEQLSFEQILEIRKQPEWINASNQHE